MHKRLYYYLSLSIISVFYTIVTLSAPLNLNRFNLTPNKTHLLQITLLLPIVMIWWIAAYGAERFKLYTSQIKQHKDGRAFDKISTGLVILVVSIILNGLFSVLRGWAYMDGWLAAFTNMSNHMAVIGPLIAYSYMYVGSVELKKLVKKRPANSKNLLAVVILMLVIVAVYLKFLLSYKYLSATPDPTRYSSYYMSSTMVFLTIALPYIVGWFLGIKAAFNIIEYRQTVKGVLYKSMLLKLVIGILVVIGFYFVVQLLTLFSTFIARAGLGSILLIVYLLIIAYSIGFLFIAAGAKQLSKIDRV